MPSKSELEAAVKQATLTQAITLDNVTDFVSEIDTMVEDAKGERVYETVEHGRHLRELYEALQNDETWRRGLTPPLRMEVERLGAKQSVEDALSPGGEIYEDFVNSPRSVLERDITRGAVSFGSGNNGTGLVHRLTVDHHGQNIQGDPDVIGYKARCIKAGSSGAIVGRERFLVSPKADRGRDALSPTWRINNPFTIDTRHTFQSAGVVNPSFSDRQRTGANAVTALTGWLKGNGDALVEADGLFALDGTATTKFDYQPTFIRFSNDLTIKQSIRQGAIDRASVVLVWIKKTGTPAGSLKLRLGTREATIAHGAITTSWSALILDQRDWWPQRWVPTSEGTIELEIEADYSSTPSAGEGFEVDDVSIVPLEAMVGGLGIAVSAGPVPWRAGSSPDTFEYTDSETAAAVSVQRALAVAYRRYLPSVGTATEVTASGGRTLTFADDDPDTITASSGSFITDGYERGQTLTVAGTSSNNGTYTIASVTATVLTLIASDELTNEGPLSATATLNATATVTNPVLP